MTVSEINQYILDNKNNIDFKENDICDGYHTFNELYEFGKMYNAALFNEWGSQKTTVLTRTQIEDDFGATFKESVVHKPKYNVHKSWKHNDGEWCFGKEKEWFIVCAMLPTGQISNHYKAEDWDLFQIPETEAALFPFDGHTPQDVLQRLKDLSGNG